jgi:membrane-bound serine protease (ClpP class)
MSMKKILIIALIAGAFGVVYSQDKPDSAKAIPMVRTISGQRVVTVLTISKAIGPITTREITSAIEKSEEMNSEALIIELNTPGGQMEATWDIIQAILASEVPIVLYVYPPGSRAASAGVFISYACQLVAMAPQTNIGSAHPVGMGGSQIDSTLSEKITNDAVAKIKTLAKKRNRNAVWAEDAVRKSVSITEFEAKELNVINYVASDLEQLIEEINGDTVDVIDGPRVIDTEDARTEHLKIGFASRVLEVVSDPNIAYLLMAIGMLGIYFEFSNPGAILPGVIGGIALLLALFSFQALPINTAGVLLILLGLILFIIEIKVTSHGLLGIGGVISLFFGSMMLINTTEFPYRGVSMSVIIPTVIVFTAFFFVSAYLAIKTHRKKVTTGIAGLKGAIAVAKTVIGPDGGTVFIHGELWNAISTGEIAKNKRVKIIDVDNMILRVEEYLEE